MEYQEEIIRFFTRLIAALILGGLIGIEREYHGRAAGIRTNIMVCLGSAIVMAGTQLFQEIYILQGSDSVFRIDPGRIAAGIITGIGFLGGGVIMKTGDTIRGLTTAASIWFVAAIGIIAGNGLFIPAAIATVLGLVVLIGLHPIDKMIASSKSENITIIGSSNEHENIIAGYKDILDQNHIVIQNIKYSVKMDKKEHCDIISIRSRKINDKHEIFSRLARLSGVNEVRWE